jgi:hypothetical protein
MPISVAQHEAPWRAGFRSARANLIPGFVLQLMALALVTAYYHHEATHAALNRYASWREDVGVVSAILSTGFFGGVLPLLYLWVQRSTRSNYNLLQGAAITLFWAYKGFEVDLLYRVLARFVGTGNEVSTIAIKTTIDQFAYCPLLAVPTTVLFYDWVGMRFNTGALKNDVYAAGWFRRKIVPLLISNFWVWLPTACIIYSLPTPLQLPLQNLVLCFYTLLVAHLSRRSELPG